MRKSFTICILLLSLHAKNQVSYNQNSVPINGNSCVGIGIQALYLNTPTGINNTAIGDNSMTYNSTGTTNTAVGSASLYYNVSGFNNTAIGGLAMFNNSIGVFNTAVGLGSLYKNISGGNNTSIGGNSLFENNTGSENVAIGFGAGNSSMGNNNLYIGRNAGWYETGNDKMYVAGDSDKTMIYGDFSTGQLLLGNHQPTGYTFKGNRTLNVVGGVISDSMRLSLVVNWADYVFADDYKLKTLNELSEYIKINKHLPNMPSADEVVKNGINVAEMDAKLLEKIEELHLYILQQQQQITHQQKQIDDLKQLIKKDKY